MTVAARDTLLAIKVLGLVPGLNANGRCVGTVLIEHFNRRTSRCDPGLARIAGLLSISERTVIRCITRLERIGLFRKVRHGGYGNRNSYEPVWSRFQEYEDSWRLKMKRQSKPVVTDLSPSTGQHCHVEGDSPVTQTCSTNLHKPTCERGLPKKTIRDFGFAIATASGKRSADAARDEAERRWNQELTKRFRSKPVTYAEILDAITPDMQAAATDAELRRRGAGINYIVNRLKLG